MISAGDFRNGVTVEIEGHDLVRSLSSSMLSRVKVLHFVRTKLQKHYQRRSVVREILPSYREIPYSSYRACRYAVSVQRRRICTHFMNVETLRSGRSEQLMLGRRFSEICKRERDG